MWVRVRDALEAKWISASHYVRGRPIPERLLEERPMSAELQSRMRVRNVLGCEVTSFTLAPREPPTGFRLLFRGGQRPGGNDAVPHE